MTNNLVTEDTKTAVQASMYTQPEKAGKPKREDGKAIIASQVKESSKTLELIAKDDPGSVYVKYNTEQAQLKINDDNTTLVRTAIKIANRLDLTVGKISVSFSAKLHHKKSSVVINGYEKANTGTPTVARILLNGLIFKLDKPTDELLAEITRSVLIIHGSLGTKNAIRRFNGPSWDKETGFLGKRLAMLGLKISEDGDVTIENTFLFREIMQSIRAYDAEINYNLCGQVSKTETPKTESIRFECKCGTKIAVNKSLEAKLTTTQITCPVCLESMTMVDKNVPQKKDSLTQRQRQKLNWANIEENRLKG
jgi:hypothetical protein